MIYYKQVFYYHHPSQKIGYYLLKIPLYSISQLLYVCFFLCIHKVIINLTIRKITFLLSFIFYHSGMYIQTLQFGFDCLQKKKIYINGIMNYFSVYLLYNNFRFIGSCRQLQIVPSFSCSLDFIQNDIFITTSGPILRHNY